MTECAILNWVAEKASLRGDAGAEARVKGGSESCGHAEERRFRQGAQHIQQP